MEGSTSADTLLPINTLMHLITIRLSPSNYLLWKSQLIPLLTHQNLMGHVDGTSCAPPSELLVDDKSSPNPAYSVWLAADQRTVIILHASLTEEHSLKLLGWTQLDKYGLPLRPPTTTLLSSAFKTYAISSANCLKAPLLLLIMVVNLRPFVISYRRLVIPLKNLIRFIGFCVALADPLKLFQLLLEPLGHPFSFGIFLRRQRGTNCFSSPFMGPSPHLLRLPLCLVILSLIGVVVVNPPMAIGDVVAVLRTINCVVQTVIMLMPALVLPPMPPMLPPLMLISPKLFMPNVMFLLPDWIDMLIPVRRTI